jgi:hypothetical protein
LGAVLHRSKNRATMLKMNQSVVNGRTANAAFEEIGGDDGDQGNFGGELLSIEGKFRPRSTTGNASIKSIRAAIR